VPDHAPCRSALSGTMLFSALRGFANFGPRPTG
jgi:hypothetical protein